MKTYRKKSSALRALKGFRKKGFTRLRIVKSKPSYRVIMRR